MFLPRLCALAFAALLPLSPPARAEDVSTLSYDARLGGYAYAFDVKFFPLSSQGQSLEMAYIHLPGEAGKPVVTLLHVLVDEYQDTNRLQSSILLSIKPDGRGLTVVGDDAQSIYSFRGATVRNILDFPHQFDPPARRITLEQNYRSTPPLLDAANAVIGEADERFVKQLWSARSGTQKPLLVSVRDDAAQAEFVVTQILARREGGMDALGLPNVKSTAVLVQDQYTGEVLFERNSSAIVPIASITKLMTAMVALDAKPALDEVLEVSEEDIDQLKGTRSRLAIGTRLTREEMLHLALMSSENRASSALSRYYPGGHAAFIAAMNRKAHDLGLADTQFFDSTGLNPRNVSSARDLAKMVAASASYPLIREFSTTRDGYFAVNGRMS